MKIGDMVKLQDVFQKGDVITRIESIDHNTITTICGILWWIKDHSDKGEDYEILSFSNYLLLLSKKE